MEQVMQFTPVNHLKEHSLTPNFLENESILNLSEMLSSGKNTNLTGKRIPYRTTTPKHHSGNKYTFQFQGSGGFDLKHRVKESCSCQMKLLLVYIKELIPLRSLMTKFFNEID